ncbi:hypothetical protein [Stenotrophomonas maltophilia]|uniref:hypothetical protein n=1 Tax=Stenotrophomonas maltophilia TaxID=40324 RepID=UPI0013DB5948|nr:hypothetical protein [Stenotrophomonas maltophilia]
MQHLHFYADSHSIDVLASGESKAILIGSDFGYGNFGDLLQHMGSISRIKRSSTLSVVSVLSLDAISRHVGVGSLRQSYGVDAQMFVSSAPLSNEKAAQLGLARIRSLRNVACVQLYGGGFLNEMWGGFVLQVTEFFLRNLPGAAYFVSGQQISAGFAEVVQHHCASFKPMLFGARDHDSLQTMQSLGVDARYSFDDAIEPLNDLSRVLTPTRADTGAFLHLNSSGYTGNSAEIEEISAHMDVLSRRSGTRDLVLFQAFQDAREEVIDSIETVKRLEGGLPFVDLNTIMLVSFIMKGGDAMSPMLLKGEYGYICSYHVTMWLQLNGIPCWLRSSNPYYDQKRKALGVEGTFEAFLEQMPMVDHTENLQQRAAWTSVLESRLGELLPIDNAMHWDELGNDTEHRSFCFKGEPRLETRLDESWAAVLGLREDVSRLNAELEEVQGQRTTVDGDRQSLEDRLVVYSERLTHIGAEARQYRQQAEHEHANWLRASQAERNATAVLQEVMQSRSWKWTLPVRVVNRFMKTRRFDAQGEVGLFEAARRVAGRLPIPAPVRLRLGKYLRGLRRG